MKKKNSSSTSTPKDPPAARKRRLQQRLREISERNDRELNALMRSVERIKATFRSKKPTKSS